MATVPPIRQTIKFEGLEEIKQKLSDLGGAGEKAFEQLRAASAPAVQSMERMEGAIENVKRSMGSVAVTGRQFGASIREAGAAFNNFEQALSRTVRSVRNYGAVLAATVAGVALFVRSGIQAGDDIEEQAQALGLSTQAYQELGFAASEAGVKQGQFASGVKIFSQQIQKASADAAKSMLAFVEGIDKNFDTLGGRIQRVTDAAVVPFTTIREAARNLQSDLAAQGISRPLFAIEEGFRKLAAGSAENRAEFERLGRVSLPAARDGLDVLRDGSEKSIKALNKLLPTFKKAEDGSIDLADAFLKTADHFEAIPAGVQKTALAMALFGRSAGPQLVPFLNEGSKKIGEFLAKTRELGLQLSGPQIAASTKAALAFDLLARSATNTKNSIGAAFAPLAATIAGGLTEFISKNQKAINDFANDLRTKATPYVEAFFVLLSGKKSTTEAGQQLTRLRDTAVQVGTAIGSAFTTLLAVLDKIAAGINDVFGTNLSGAALGVILVITKMVGGFTLLLSGLKLLGAAFVVFNNGLKLAVASGGLFARTLALIALHPFVRLLILAAGALTLFGDKLGLAGRFASLLGVASSEAAPKVDSLSKNIKTLGEKSNTDSLQDNIKKVGTVADEAKPKVAGLRGAFEDLDKPLTFTIIEGSIADIFVKFGAKVVSVTQKIIAQLKARWTEFFDWLEARKTKPGTEPTLSDMGNVTPQTTGETVDKLASIGPKTQASAQQATAAINQTTESVKNLGTAAVDATIKTVTVLGGVANSAKQVVPAVKESSDAYARLADAFGPVEAAAQSNFRITSQGIIQNIQGTNAFKHVIEQIGPTFEQSQAAVNRFNQGITTAGRAAASSFDEVGMDIGVVAEAFGFIQTKAQTAMQAVAESITSAFAPAEAAIQKLMAQLDAAIAKAQQLAASASSAGSSSFDEAGFEGFARGGRVWGPGTSTSDSIPARLSRGEFVHREKAVRYYGADFMAALNALRLPKDLFRGFSMGGLADGLNRSLSSLMIPRFAAGGLADMAPAVASSSGRSLTLVLDGQRFAGLRGPDDTIARLEKHAIAQQSGSTGRKPSWVR